MRMLKFACVAVFLWGYVSDADAMCILLDKDGKPLKGLADVHVPNLLMAHTQPSSDTIGSKVAELSAAAIGTIGFCRDPSFSVDPNYNFKWTDSKVLPSTSVAAPMGDINQWQISLTEARALTLASSEPLQTYYDAYLKLKELVKTAAEAPLSPAQKQMLETDVEYQSLLTQIDSLADLTAWYAPDGSTIDLYDLNHFLANKTITAKIISAEHKEDFVDEEAMASSNTSQLTFTDYEIEETLAAENEPTADMSPMSKNLVIYYGNSNERRIHKIKFPL